MEGARGASGQACVLCRCACWILPQLLPVPAVLWHASFMSNIQGLMIWGPHGQCYGFKKFCYLYKSQVCNLGLWSCHELCWSLKAHQPFPRTHCRAQAAAGTRPTSWRRSPATTTRRPSARPAAPGSPASAAPTNLRCGRKDFKRIATHKFAVRLKLQTGPCMHVMLVSFMSLTT